MKQNLDREFSERYEKAVENLNDQQLSQVAKLSESKLLEWLNSPAKIRPHLLKRWADEGTLEYESGVSIDSILFNTRTSLANLKRSSGHTFNSLLKDLSDHYKPKVEQRRREEAERKREQAERRKQPPKKKKWTERLIEGLKYIFDPRITK